jgi:hypothetical protein
MLQLTKPIAAPMRTLSSEARVRIALSLPVLYALGTFRIFLRIGSEHQSTPTIIQAGVKFENI